MIISHKRKLWFFHIPKTGGSSISQALRHIDKANYPNQQGVFASNTHVKYQDCYKTYKDYSDYFKFAFVRNPWTRLFSCFTATKKHQRGGVTIKLFTQFVHSLERDQFAQHTQFSYICKDSEVAMDFVGRFENFDYDFQFVLSQVGVSYAKAPRVNVSNTRWDYKKFYTEETRRIAEDYYKIDIDTFGYSYDQSHENITTS